MCLEAVAKVSKYLNLFLQAGSELQFIFKAELKLWYFRGMKGSEISAAEVRD